jgi:hypothetical protein
MSSTTIALASTGCIFAGALLGMGLQKVLPGYHLSKESHDIVKLGAGIIATLTALVLGLLISTAKSSFDAVNDGIVQSSAKIILLDRALARYGPETKATREQLQRAVAASIESVWPRETPGVPALDTVERANGLELLQDKLRELTPQNEAQHQALARIQQLVADLSQIRWLLIEQGQSGFPFALLLVLVFWLTLLFVSFGLFAPRNATVVAVLFVSACSVSAAIFLVLELNQPVSGFVKISNAPLRNALQHLGQ